MSYSNGLRVFTVWGGGLCELNEVIQYVVIEGNKLTADKSWASNEKGPAVISLLHLSLTKESSGGFGLVINFYFYFYFIFPHRCIEMGLSKFNLDTWTK